MFVKHLLLSAGIERERPACRRHNDQDAASLRGGILALCFMEGIEPRVAASEEEAKISRSVDREAIPAAGTIVKTPCHKEKEVF